MKRLLFPVLCFIAFIIPKHVHSQEIGKLKAFAESYGYVKYFHPSDQAYELDWNSFAIYGVQELLELDSDEEVVEKLNEIYSPIAPTVQFYLASKEVPFDKQILNPNQLKTNDVTYWQHQGVSFGMLDQKTPYTSRRVNIDKEIDESAKFGNIMKRMDATPYQGMDFVFSAAIKMEDNSSGVGQLWFRVDRSDGKRGFFENMRANPIRSTKWAEYQIKGTIDEAAERINFGCFLNGEGALYFDEPVLKVSENGGDWEVVELDNPGFEEKGIDKKPKGENWFASALGYDFKVVNEETYAGEKSAKITFEGLSYTEKGKPLFDEKIEAEEIFESKLSESITAQIPLSLYLHENQTLPKVGSIITFNETLIPLKEKSSEDLSVRLANVIELYALIKHFYPYVEVSGAKLDLELEKALQKSYSDQTDEDHIKTLEAMTAPLNDGHIRVYGKSYQRHAPDIRWQWIEDQLVITKVMDTSLRISRGDVVEKVNSFSAEAYYTRFLELASASTDLNKQYQANTNSLLGKEGSNIALTIEGKEHLLKRTHNIWDKNREDKSSVVQFSSIEGGISYVNLNVISMDSIRSLLPKLEESKAIIFDLRKYPNGNHEVIEYLLEEKDNNMNWMQIPEYIYPNQKGLKSFQEHGWGLKPSKPHLGDKKIIFITSGEAISYAESFMGFVEGYDLGTIVGESTAGTNGNVNTIVLNDNVYFSFTGMLVYKFDGELLHGRGITPDIYVQRTIAGVRAGNDEFLEKAIELCREE